MSDRENCFSTAIKLLDQRGMRDDQMTSETLISLLRLLERNELQHSQDYAALDALTRKLTSLVAHLAEHTIADDDFDVRGALARVETQLGILSQTSGAPVALVGETVSHHRDVRRVRPDGEAVAQASRRKAPVTRAVQPDALAPAKRSFVDVVADISRRRDGHGSETGDAAVACLEAVRSRPDEYHVDTAANAAEYHAQVPHFDRELDEDEDEFALEQMLGQLERITDQLERSERMLSSLPELVDTVDELITEIDQSQDESDGARVSRDPQPVPESSGARTASDPRQDFATSSASARRAQVGASPQAFAARNTDGMRRERPTTQSATMSAAGSAGSARKKAPIVARAKATAQPRRLLSLASEKFGHRRWRPLAGACALFVAANMAMAFEVANSRMEPAAAIEDAQHGLPAMAAGVDAPAASTSMSRLLSHEQIAQAPSALVMPTLIAQGGGAPTSRLLGSGEASAPASSRAVADYQLGMRYIDPRLAPPDFKEAACLFERAAAGGLAPGQYRLALLLERGLGVPKNVERAKALYRHAAEAGHVRAMHNLGVLVSQSDTPDAYKTAAVWFDRAARFGIVDSQYNLGVLFSKGLGVPQSAAQAYRWFSIAAKQGDVGARRERDALAPTLGAAELAAAKADSAAFVASAAAPEANVVPTDDVGTGGVRLRKIAVSIAAPCTPNAGASLRVSMK